METNTEENRQQDEAEKEMPPTEDLMREHGVLKRILLIYEDVEKRLKGEKGYDPYLINPVILHTASIARNFIENYHQRLEENYVFPKFIHETQYVDLVRVLQEQHEAARRLTDMIRQSAISPTSYHWRERAQFAHTLNQYIHMYEPHEAREDTVLFPAFREMVGGDEFKRLGEQFEEIEEKMFGKNGFKRIVNQVAQLEKSLGIYELAQFTPLFIK
ncbi:MULTISPECIES: hemerythrin domain-containing protein [Paenibacillus]|uniref:hemerythrin domain-containing protein n=1 Tax=Paenibacillus TaxID=44249 RepID=UPI000675FAA3|nr:MULTISPECIES: hemerythrin domain-containing protein [Paenibacillus]MEC0259809.1 hemerythrin domain-containing protein [Paenibacillus lautus]